MMIELFERFMAWYGEHRKTIGTLAIIAGVIGTIVTISQGKFPAGSLLLVAAGIINLWDDREENSDDANH